jgi:hypothetical protein
VISETSARCPIAERRSVSAESGYDAGEREKVVMTEAISQGSASVGARFLAQDFDRGQDERSSIIRPYQLE